MAMGSNMAVIVVESCLTCLPLRRAVRGVQKEEDQEHKMKEGGAT